MPYIYLYMISGGTPEGVDATGFARFIRCGIAREAITTFSNLSHLEGQKVAILANGNFLGFQIVSGGQITLPSYYSKIIVGVPYVSDFETLAIEVPTKQGSIQGQFIKVSNVIFRLLRSLGGKIGPSFDKLYEVFSEDELRKSNQVHELDDPLGSVSPILYSTDIRKPLGAEYRGGGNVCVRQVKSLPLTISSVTPEITAGGAGIN